MTSTQAFSPEELETLQGLEPFARLPEPLRDETLDCWERCTAEPGELIVKKGHEQTHLYVVFGGMVRVIGSARRREPDPLGHVLGIRALLHGEPSDFDALVALPTTYARLPAAHFHRVCDTGGDLKAMLLQVYKPPAARPQPSGTAAPVEPRSTFTFFQDSHGEQPWGSVLDAGTGEASLRWIMGLPTERWVAVTGDPAWTRHLQDRFGAQFRAQDRLVEQNWTDDTLLEGETFDAVIADYLLGAVESFAPYFQERLFARLRPHVGGRLYVAGLEPPDLAEPVSDAGRRMQTIIRLRDAMLVMLGKPRFREYPLEWVERSLRESGYAIEATGTFPKTFGPQDVHAILDNCLRLLPDLDDSDLVVALAHHIDALRREALSLPETHTGVLLSHDYAVVARPK